MGATTTAGDATREGGVSWEKECHTTGDLASAPWARQNGSGMLSRPLSERDLTGHCRCTNRVAGTPFCPVFPPSNPSPPLGDAQIAMASPHHHSPADSDGRPARATLRGYPASPSPSTSPLPWSSLLFLCAVLHDYYHGLHLVIPPYLTQHAPSAHVSLLCLSSPQLWLQHGKLGMSSSRSRAFQPWRSIRRHESLPSVPPA